MEIKANVDVIIIACTDLSIVTGSARESISIIDSSLELAKELVGKYKEMK